MTVSGGEPAQQADFVGALMAESRRRNIHTALDTCGMCPDSSLGTLATRADLVLYDYLANEVFLEYARPEAELIYVGKKAGHHAKSQDEINNIICEKALAGLMVTRLKGGDPFIFGRGGEEA